MRTTLRAGMPAMFIGAVLFAAGCGGSGPAATVGNDPAPASSDAASIDATVTRPRPAVFADLPGIELIGPAGSDVGRTPTFEWHRVDNAAAYRLSVLAPDAPSWAWQGTDTSVRYGGVPDGVSGPSLRAGSWWSVVALADDGLVIAMSELRAVSPGADPGIEPGWANPGTNVAGSSGNGSAEPSASPAAPSTESDRGPITGRACDLLTGDEITAAIKGEWGEPTLQSYGQHTTCEWRSANGTLFYVALWPESNYDPEGWGADGTVDGLGDRAYTVNHGWDRRIGFLHDQITVTMVIDYTKVDMAGMADLAHLVESRLD